MYLFSPSRNQQIKAQSFLLWSLWVGWESRKLWLWLLNPLGSETPLHWRLNDAENKLIKDTPGLFLKMVSPFNRGSWFKIFYWFVIQWMKNSRLLKSTEIVASSFRLVLNSGASVVQMSGWDFLPVLIFRLCVETGSRCRRQQGRRHHDLQHCLSFNVNSCCLLN